MGDDVFSLKFFWTCEMLLCSVEFVLHKENLKAQSTCTVFRTARFWNFGYVD